MSRHRRKIRKHGGSQLKTTPEVERWAKAKVDIEDILMEYENCEQMEALLGVVETFRALHPPKAAVKLSIEEILDHEIFSAGHLADGIFYSSGIFNKLKS